MPNILVIENDAAIVELIKQSLAPRGAILTISGDGAEGIGFARENDFDLILLSVELPRVSGYSVCNKLKKDSSLAAIPLILMSAEASAETFAQHKKLRTHAEGYLHKPLDVSELLHAVGPYCSAAVVNVAAVPSQRDAAELDDMLEIDLDEFGLDDDDDTGVSEVPIESGVDDLMDEDVLGSLDVLDAMENGLDFDLGHVSGVEVVGADPVPQDGGRDVHTPTASPRPASLDDANGGGASHSTPIKLAEQTTLAAPVAPEASSEIKAEETRYLSDNLLEGMRSEISALRNKVRSLEETLEAKELDFNERLFQESTRVREAIGERQRASQIQYDLEKVQVALQNAEAQKQESFNKISSLAESLRAGELREESLSKMIARLEFELDSSRNSEALSHAKIQELQGQVDALTGQLREDQVKRHQARELISSMMHVLADNNGQANSAD